MFGLHHIIHGYLVAYMRRVIASIISGVIGPGLDKEYKYSFDRDAIILSDSTKGMIFDNNLK